MDQQAETTEQRKTAVSGDGFIYDEETGEVIGHVEDQADRPFRVESEDGANWVLRLKLQAEADIARIEAERAAINANLDGRLVDPRNRLRWLAHRFDGSLVEWAKARLEGARTRTVKLTFGRVAFVRSKGSAEITDQAAALAYVEEWAPRLVKKTVSLTAVQAAMQLDREANGEEPQVAAFLKAAEPRDTATIKTGIGKDADR